MGACSRAANGQGGLLDAFELLNEFVLILFGQFVVLITIISLHFPEFHHATFRSVCGGIYQDGIIYYAGGHAPALISCALRLIMALYGLMFSR